VPGGKKKIKNLRKCWREMSVDPGQGADCPGANAAGPPKNGEDAGFGISRRQMSSPDEQRRADLSIETGAIGRTD